MPSPRGVVPATRPVSRTSTSSTEIEGPSPNKRARMSASTPTIPASRNGSVAESPSQRSSARQSARIASMSPVVSDDGRKRLRKT